MNPDRRLPQGITGLTGGTETVPNRAYLSLRELSAHSCLSIRKLREYLYDPIRPLPHYRVGGKILVKRSEFDSWMIRYRRAGVVSVDAIVEDVLRDLG